MTAEIIPFPTPRPWAKYIHNAASRANAEQLYEALLNIREKYGGRGCPPALPVEAAERDTVELLQRCREGVPGCAVICRLRVDPFAGERFPN